MSIREDLSMVVLAGGASRRMGTDKSDLRIQGKTFLEQQIAKGKELGISEILVSGYRGAHCSVPVILDRYPGKGPLAGLEACFREMKTKYCLVLSVDVPLVPPEELEKLIDCAMQSDRQAVILCHQGHEESLIGVYETALADAMEEEICQRKGSVFAFLNRIGYAVYDSEGSDDWFANVNDPQSYQEIIEKNIQ